MIRHSRDGIEWLEFENLAEEKEITHRVYLRKGGFGTGAYEEFNLSETVDPESYHANIEKLRRGEEISHLFRPEMAHGADVVQISSIDDKVSEPCDGLLTDLQGVGLLSSHADCQIALMYDPVNRAIANIHCGWRGNVQKIYSKSVISMREKYGTKPENLLVGITPSLGPDYSEFINYKKEFPESFLAFRKGENKFDLWAIAESELLGLGILPHHLEIASVCTYSHPEDFFSYRRDKITGRNGTLIYLKNSVRFE